jgi:hypothetical protein
MSANQELLLLTDGTIVHCQEAGELELEIYQRPTEGQGSSYIRIKGRASVDELARALVKFLGRGEPARAGGGGGGGGSTTIQGSNGLAVGGAGGGGGGGGSTTTISQDVCPDCGKPTRWDESRGWVHVVASECFLNPRS